MEVITSSFLKSIVISQKRKLEGLLPELVKRLIINSCPDRTRLRIPSCDDIWAPGFDGVVSVESGTSYVSEGQSVWEFGTSSDSLKKINKDYDKRTEDPQGIVPEDTTFYLVIPKVWRYAVSIPEWEATHSDAWKSVHIYDAPVLCDWINSEPVVCAWFLEQFSEKHSDGFSTVDAAWDHFSNLTTPALSHTLFTIGRTEIIQQFCDRLKQKSCFVRADTFYDACGFCLSALLQNKETANTAIVVSNEESYQTLSKHLQEKVFLLLFPYSGQVSDANHTVLCFSRESTQRQGALRLPSLWKTQFKKAVLDMGLTETQASELYAFTHGNLLSLIRRIPGNAADITPKWASSPGIELLHPLVFLRNYNPSDENAQRIISLLANDDAVKIQQQYDVFCRMEDAPLKRVDNCFTITNYEEAWLTLQIDLSNLASRRLNSTILALLSKYKDGTVFVPSSTGAMIERLLFNYIYFKQTGSDETIINSQVKEILDFLNYPNCQTILLNALPNLAEAAPTEVVAFLEKLFLPDQLPLFDQLQRSYKSHSIIWALERLTCAQSSAIRACKLIIKLSNLKAFDTYGVSSRELLLTTLCLWDNHTPITPKEKTIFVDNLLKDNPSFGIPFALDLLDKQTILRGIRLGAKVNSYPEAKPEELRIAYLTIASSILTAVVSQKELRWFEKLLHHYSFFKVDDLAMAALEFHAQNYSTKELIPLLFFLHEQVFEIRNYQMTERIPCINSLQAWIFRISADDPILQVAWMFFEHYKTPFEGVLDIEEDDYDLRKERAQKIRIGAFSNLKTRFGINAALALIQYMEDRHDWGVFLANNLAIYELEPASRVITEQGKLRILAGMLDTAPLSCFEPIFSSLPSELQRKILPSLYRTDIMDWLSTPELQHAYWGNKDLRFYDERSYKSLLQHNPSGILYYLYKRQNEHPGIDEMLLEVLHALVADGKACNEAILKSLIKEVDGHSYSDEWAALCVQLVNVNLIKIPHYDGYYPECLKTYFFQNPTCITELNSTSPELFSKLFSRVYRLPSTAYRDYHRFRQWSDYLYQFQDCHELSSILSDAFARAPNGEDGIFPHEFVRIALEDYSNPSLSINVAISKLFSRGVRTVTDGLYEKQLADQSLQNARALELRYPQSSAILRYIADDYTAESKSDRRYAEMGFFD